MENTQHLKLVLDTRVTRHSVIDQMAKMKDQQAILFPPGEQGIRSGVIGEGLILLGARSEKGEPNAEAALRSRILSTRPSNFCLIDFKRRCVLDSIERAAGLWENRNQRLKPD